MSSLTVARFYTSEFTTNNCIEVSVIWEKHAYADGRQGFIVSKLTRGPWGDDEVKSYDRISTHTSCEAGIEAGFEIFRTLRADYKAKTDAFIASRKPQ